jgi:hypothetical protein
MKMETASFRHGEELLQGSPVWTQFQKVVGSIEGLDIQTAQEARRSSPRQAPVGAQTALNDCFRARMQDDGWESEVNVFPSGGNYPVRKLDYRKSRIGVEIAFNNSSYLERIVLRLNVASEAPQIADEDQLIAGILVVASPALKAWGRMDATVATFDSARRTLDLVKNSFSIPLILVSLGPDAAAWKRFTP